MYQLDLVNACATSFATIEAIAMLGQLATTRVLSASIFTDSNTKSWDDNILPANLKKKRFLIKRRVIFFNKAFSGYYPLYFVVNAISQKKKDYNYVKLRK